tara:strand:- start:1606 stop:1788 length:183 start_codon:yes stop_codon:yes gene_type:complete
MIDNCIECGEHKECSQMFTQCDETGWVDTFPACRDCETDPNRAWAGERKNFVGGGLYATS